MTVPSLTDTWRITMKMHAGTPAYPIQTVFHVTAPILSDFQLVANQAGAAWTAGGSIRSKQISPVVYDTVTVQPFDGSSAPHDLTVTGYTGLTGGAGTTGVSAQTSMLITKRTGLAGRRYRGRMYVAGAAYSDLQPDGAQWATAAVTSWQAAVTTWATALITGGPITTLVVYSHRYNTKANVSQLLVRQYTGTQRRRSEPNT